MEGLAMQREARDNYAKDTPKRTSIQDLTQTGHDTLMETANILRSILVRLRGETPEDSGGAVPVDGSYLGCLHRHNDLIREVHVMVREISDLTSG